MRGVAEAAGVSVATVSLALRNHPSIPKKTRKHVTGVAKRLDYKPNPLVSAFVAHSRSGRPLVRHQVIAYLSSHPKPLTQSNHVTRHMEGARERAALHGFKVEEIWLKEPGMTPARIDKILATRNIRAVIINRLPAPLRRIKLDWSALSAVVIGASVLWPELHRLMHSQPEALWFALRQLKRRGYRRVGFAELSDSQTEASKFSMHTFHVAKRSIYNQDDVPSYMGTSLDRRDPARFLKWLKSQKIDALMSPSGALVEIIKNEGIDIPGRMGFLHINCPEDDFRFTGIFRDKRLLGAVAVDYVVSMLYRNERGIPDYPQTILLKCKWREGETLLKKV
jgi:LacI family transcriptional regulator